VVSVIGKTRETCEPQKSNLKNTSQYTLRICGARYGPAACISKQRLGWQDRRLCKKVKCGEIFEFALKKPAEINPVVREN
jgi:hypothetical protein